jgi:hypothetical protein
LELMDMMAVYQEGAYERLCRQTPPFFFCLPSIYRTTRFILI